MISLVKAHKFYIGIKCAEIHAHLLSNSIMNQLSNSASTNAHLANIFSKMNLARPLVLLHSTLRHLEVPISAIIFAQIQNFYTGINHVLVSVNLLFDIKGIILLIIVCHLA